MTSSRLNATSDVTWFLDTGASNHMCGKKEFFTNLDKRQLGNVTFGDLS